MAAGKLVNRAWMSTATTGTGTITLGSALSGYQTFAAAGVANADVVSYTIIDGAGWEIGTGTYTSAGTTLTRSVDESSNSGSALNLSGSATVFVSARVVDIRPTSTTDNTAARYDGAVGALQSSALVIADTTGALSRSGNGGIPVQGTNTNDNAAAGYVGEYTSASASGVSLTTNVAADVVSVSLTAGDWMVSGVFSSVPSTNFTALRGWLNTASATEPTPPVGGSYRFSSNTAIVEVEELFIPIGPARFSLSSTTTVYLGTRQTFSGTNSVKGFIQAWRVR